MTEIPVPEVLFAEGARRLGFPQSCVLVTRALEVEQRELEPDPVLNVVYALRDAGVFHPDLHSDNFVPLVDGRIAVLDMQSARVRRAITTPDFTRMLTTLIAHRAFQAPTSRRGVRRCASAATTGSRSARSSSSPQGQRQVAADLDRTVHDGEHPIRCAGRRRSHRL